MVHRQETCTRPQNHNSLEKLAGYTRGWVGEGTGSIYFMTAKIARHLFSMQCMKRRRQLPVTAFKYLP